MFPSNTHEIKSYRFLFHREQCLRRFGKKLEMNYFLVQRPDTLRYCQEGWQVDQCLPFHQMTLAEAKLFFDPTPRVCLVTIQSFLSFFPFADGPCMCFFFRGQRGCPDGHTGDCGIIHSLCSFHFVAFCLLEVQFRGSLPLSSSEPLPVFIWKIAFCHLKVHSPSLLVVIWRLILLRCLLSFVFYCLFSFGGPLPFVIWKFILLHCLIASLPHCQLNDEM